jgi:hypothetical protein
MSLHSTALEYAEYKVSFWKGRIFRIEMKLRLMREDIASMGRKLEWGGAVVLNQLSTLWDYCDPNFNFPDHPGKEPMKPEEKEKKVMEGIASCEVKLTEIAWKNAPLVRRIGEMKKALVAEEVHLAKQKEGLREAEEWLKEVQESDFN